MIQNCYLTVSQIYRKRLKCMGNMTPDDFKYFYHTAQSVYKTGGHRFKSWMVSEFFPDSFMSCHVIDKKKKLNKTQPCITELVHAIHTSVLCFPGTCCLLTSNISEWIDRVQNFSGLVLCVKLSCGYALVASRLLCFIWNSWFLILNLFLAVCQILHHTNTGISIIVQKYC